MLCWFYDVYFLFMGCDHGSCKDFAALSRGGGSLNQGSLISESFLKAFRQSCVVDERQAYYS